MTFRVPPRAGKSAIAAQFAPISHRFADRQRAEQDAAFVDAVADMLDRYLARWQAARWQF